MNEANKIIIAGLVNLVFECIDIYPFHVHGFKMSPDGDMVVFDFRLEHYKELHVTYTFSIETYALDKSKRLTVEYGMRYVNDSFKSSTVGEV